MSLPPLPDGASIDEVPELPEGATLDVLPALPLGAAMDETAEQPAATPMVDDIGFEPPREEFVTPAGKREAEDELLRFAVDQASTVGDDDVAAQRISRKLGVPKDEVKAALPSFRRTEMVTEFDADRFRASAPQEVLRLLNRQPSLAPHMVKSEVGGPIIEGIKRTLEVPIDIALNPVDFIGTFLFRQRNLESGATWVRNTSALGLQWEANLWRIDLESKDDERRAKAEEWFKENAADLKLAEQVLAKGDYSGAPKVVEQVEDAQAQQAREEGLLSVDVSTPFPVGPDGARRFDPDAGITISGGLVQRGKETVAGLDEARWRLMRRWSKVWGASPEELSGYDAVISERAEAARPRHLGEGELAQLLTQAQQGAITTAQTVPETIEGMGGGAAVGAAVGGFLSQRAGLGWRVGAAKGAEAGAKWGAAFGATAAAFYVEAGSTDRDLEELETDDKKKLTDEQILAGSIFAGTIKAGLETLQTAAILKTLGPGVRAAVERFFSVGGPRELVKEMALEPGGRAALQRAGAQLLRSANEEALEEVGQGAVEDVTSYLWRSYVDGALQSGPLVSKDKALEGYVGGYLGGLLLGTMGTAAGLTHEARTGFRGITSAQQVETLYQLSEQPLVEAQPGEFGKLVTETTTRAGKPVVSTWVSAKPIVDYYQTKGVAPAEAEAEVVGLLGEEAPAVIAAAAASENGRIEVPLGAALGGFLQSELGKAMRDHMATDSVSPTVAQMREMDARVEQQALELAQQELQRLEEDAVSGNRAAQFLKQLLATGVVDEEMARAAAKVPRQLQEMLAKRFGLSVAQFFTESPIEYLKGEDDTAQTVDPLEPIASGMDAARRAEVLFIDPVTQLRNERGMGEVPAAAGTQKAAVTILDTKPINDDWEFGSHDVANAMFASLGKVVQQFDPNATRVGTTFHVDVADEAGLKAVEDAVRAALPEKFSVAASMAADAPAARAALDVAVNEARKAGKLPERGKTFADIKAMRPFAPNKGEKNVTPGMLQKAGAMSLGDFIRTALRDPKIPQLLTREAFELLGEMPHVAALDLRGIRDLNERGGHALGDAVIEAFGRALVAVGGEAFRAAHFSGDEYALAANDRATLERLLARLEHELSKISIGATFKDGSTVENLRPYFRVGIAERTYGAADRELNRRKSLEQQRAATAQPQDARGGGRVPEGAPGESDRLGEGVAPVVPDRSSGADFGATRDDGSLPDWVAEDVVDRGEVVLEERSAALDGNLRAQEAEAIRQGFNWPEAIAAARASIERWRASRPRGLDKMAQPARLGAVLEAEQRLELRQRAAEEYLRYVEGRGPGLAVQGWAMQPVGALVVDEELYRQLEGDFRRDFNIIDPQNGLARLTELAKDAVDADLRRARQHAAKTVYDREMRRDRRREFNRHARGQGNNALHQGPRPIPMEQRDPGLEAKLDAEGRDYSVLAGEDGSVSYWSWADDGTVRIDFSEAQREAVLGNDADAARWRDTKDPGIDGATLRSARAASAPSPEAVEQMREDGVPVRLDGTVSAQEVVDTVLFQTRKADEWLEAFANHPAVVDTYSKKDIEEFSRAVMAHRQLVQEGIDLGLLPDEGDASPLRSNQDFIKSFDISTICPRQDTFTATIKAVERKLGRLLEPMQRHLVGLMLRDVGAQPACWYCYGQAGRNAYDAVIGQSHQKTLMVIDLYRAASRSGKKVTGEQFNAIFQNKELGTNWKPDSELALYLKKNWLKLSKAGVPDPVRLRDLARGDVLPRNDVEGEYARAVRNFTQAATKANDPKGWGTLRSQILDTRSLPQAKVDRLNARAGLRMNSQTDFRPWHVIEVSEAIASMKARGLKAHVYTKESGFLRAFGKTGIKFNLSAFYKRGSDGRIQLDERGKPVLDDVIGMSAAEVEYWVKELPNDAGGMLVAHNDEALLHGLNDDRIHQVIPYHAGPIAKEKGIGAIEGARDYASFQHEHGWERRKSAVGVEVKVGDEWVRAGRPAVVMVNGKEVTVRAGKDLDASTHGSDQKLYLALCKKLGLTPKFAELTLTVDGKTHSVIDHPGYMKLVRDVAREPGNHTVPDPKRIDWKAATDIESKWVDAGGDSTDPNAPVSGKAPVETPVLAERRKQFDNLVNYVIGRVNRGQWPEAGKVHTPEEIAAANRKQYGRKGGGTLAPKWAPPGLGDLKQWPTPEQSKARLAEHIALLDSLLEAGAKALEEPDEAVREAKAAVVAQAIYAANRSMLMPNPEETFDFVEDRADELLNEEHPEVLRAAIWANGPEHVRMNPRWEPATPGASVDELRELFLSTARTVRALIVAGVPMHHAFTEYLSTLDLRSESALDEALDAAIFSVTGKAPEVFGPDSVAQYSPGVGYYGAPGDYKLPDGGVLRRVEGRLPGPVGWQVIRDGKEAAFDRFPSVALEKAGYKKKRRYSPRGSHQQLEKFLNDVNKRRERVFTQLPTPEQSAERMAEHQAMLDALAEAGAKALEDGGPRSLQELGEDEVALAAFDAVAYMQSVRTSRAGIRNQLLEMESEMFDAIERSEEAGWTIPNRLLQLLEEPTDEELDALDFNAMRQSFRKASELAQRIVDAGLAIPASSVIEDDWSRLRASEKDAAPRKGRRPESRAKELEAFLNKVNEQKRRMFQPGGDGGSAAEQPKGYTRVNPLRRAQSVIKVFLNETADISTVVHETMHVFLEQFLDACERPDAPPDVLAIRDALFKELGVTNREDIEVRHHELVARSFEQYLMEGNAPSAQLAGLFQKFKLWLLDIYKSLRGVPGANLTPALRDVFDRLLATDEEIEAFRKKSGADQVVRDPSDTDAAHQAKLDALREEAHELNRKEQLHALKERQRVNEKWYQRALEKEREAAAEEYEELPARRAQRILEGDNPLGEAILLDEQAVRDVLGDRPRGLNRARLWALFGRFKQDGDGKTMAGVNRTSLRKRGLRTAKDGVNPDVVAEMAGFPTGEAMLLALGELQPKEAYVKAIAEERMKERYPTVLDDRTKLAAAVADNLSRYTERRLLAEGVLSKEEMKVAKRAAELMVERRTLGRLSPNAALAAQRKAARAKARANAIGDWTATHQHAKDEALQAAIYRQVLDAREERDALEKKAKEMGKAKALARLGKSSELYQQAVLYLLEAVGLKPSSGLTDAALGAVVPQLEGDAVEVGDPAWLEPVRKAIVRTQALREKPGSLLPLWTVAEARQLGDALEMLQAGARRRTVVLSEDKEAEFEAAKAAILDDLASTLPVLPPMPEPKARNFAERLRAGYQGVSGFLLSPVDMARSLVGDNINSALWRYVVSALRGAEIRKADLLKKTLEPLMKAFETMPKSVRRSWGNRIDGALLFNGHIEGQGVSTPRFRYELLMMALNAGNEQNMRVLTEGRNISETQVRDALNLLTAEEIEWVNTVHKAAESLREPAFALEQRITGIRPKAVEGRPLALRNGTLEGGYFPLKAIKDVSNAGQKQALSDLFDPSFSRPVTAHGHLKQRTGATYPVSLDPGVILQHLTSAVHDIAFREPVLSVASLMMDEGIRKAMAARIGAPRLNQWMEWLKDVAAGRPRTPDDEFSRAADWLKRNMSSAMLSGLSTAIGNLANIPAAVASTKLKAKHLASGLSLVTSDWKGARDFALETSGALRTLERDMVAGVEREVRDIGASDWARGMSWVREAGMAAMKAIDTAVSTAVWLGAYQQALEEGLGDDAARWADDILLQAQPSSSMIERAGILRNKTGVGYLVMFYGYLSLAYRANSRLADPLMTQEFRNASPGEKAVIAGKVAGRMLGFWVAFGVLGELLMGRGPEDGDKDKDEPDSKGLQWMRWFLRKLVVSPLQLIPGIPVGRLVESKLLHKRAGERGDALGGAFMQAAASGEAIMGALEGRVPPGKAMGEALRLAGILTGAPVRLVEPGGSYLWNTTVGDRPAPSVNRAASGLVYGEREENQPITPFTAFE